MTEQKTPLLQTSSQTVGPFFHYGLIFGKENILVNDQTQGQRIRITGTVFDGDGEPIPDALVEIWQADVNGYFDHSEDPNQDKADKNFKYFGRSDTVNNGVYTFKTVKPAVAVCNNDSQEAPYVCVRVFSRGMLIHAVTRMYFPEEANNQTDALLNSIDESRRQTLIAELEENNDLPTYRFDIHIQGDKETVFLDI